MRSKKGLKVFVDAYLLSKEPQGTVTYLKGLYTAVTRQNPDIDFYLRGHSGFFVSQRMVSIYHKKSIFRDFGTSIRSVRAEPPIFLKSSLMTRWELALRACATLAAAFNSKRCRWP